MSNKNNLLLLFILFTFIFAAVTPIQAEIIKTSQLEQTEKEKGKKQFTITRDIFSPFKKVIDQNPAGAPLRRPPEEIQKPPEEENKVKERDVAGEVKRRVAYEGYVMRDAKKLALLTVDAEFFVVGVDDIVKETIRIVNIEKQFVTVEVEANLIEINIKGDQDNEIQ